MTDPAVLFETIRDEVGTVLVGNEDVLEGLTIALLTRGHVLLEGVPGVAKTTIASLFARSIGLKHRRIQMTPDLLPADITGTRVYRSEAGEFELQKGPIFSNIVLADEINRATPKTQSALLEAMQERQVTLEGETHKLPDTFMVIATQNPIEMEGTFGLPEAQRDRFQLKLRVGLPDRTHEAELLDTFNAEPETDPTDIESIIDLADVRSARDAVVDVFLKDSIREYILDIIEGSRESTDVEYGASPRAAISLLETSKAHAALKGRNYVIPDDPKRMAELVLAHRLVLSTDAELSDVTPRAVVRDVLDSVAMPDESDEYASTAAVGDGGKESEPRSDDGPTDKRDN